MIFVLAWCWGLGITRAIPTNSSKGLEVSKEAWPCGWWLNGFKLRTYLITLKNKNLYVIFWFLSICILLYISSTTTILNFFSSFFSCKITKFKINKKSSTSEKVKCILYCKVPWANYNTKTNLSTIELKHRKKKSTYKLEPKNLVQIIGI